MRSRIFSSKYIRTISMGNAWIPAFLTLGFLLAFPVTGLVKLGSWQNMEYTVDQMGVLYNHLWKDGFVLAGMFVAAIAAFMNSVNGFIYLYSGKKTDFYHGLPLKRSEIFTENKGLDELLQSWKYSPQRHSVMRLQSPETMLWEPWWTKR